MFNVRTMAAAAAFGIAAAVAPQAHATLLIEAGGGVGAGGVITGATVEATDPTNTDAGANFSFGSFNVNRTSIGGVNLFGGNGLLMDVGTFDVSTSGSGSLSLFFIETGLTGTSPAVLSASFSAAPFNGISVSRSIFFDPTDTGIESDLLITSTGPNAAVANVPFDFDGTYALIEEIDLTALSGGATLSGDDQISVPEPMSLALVGGGLFGLGLIRRRK